MRLASALVLLALAAPPGEAVEVQPRVGAEFDHFGETWRITADRDTVTVVDDYGTFAGLALRTAGAASTRFELDLEGYAGHSTRHARERIGARWTGAADRLELRQEGTWRVFTEGGDYSVSGDHFEQRLSTSWEHRLDRSWSFRLRDVLDGVWYRDPDPYNLTSWIHEPGAEVRLDFGEWSRVRAGYRFAKRDVPDSTTLGYRRHGGELGLSWLTGVSVSIDLAETLERREYVTASVRESSWENRAELRFEVGLGERATCRLVHENEVVRFDEPDELDFDFDRARTGIQLEIHGDDRLDLSLMPIHAFLASAVAPEEEYTELGVEVGADWRFARHGWVSVTDEVGRRDYELNAVPAVLDPGGDLTADTTLDTASSDYVYNRLTLMFGAQPFSGITVSLFVHWQPEDHDLSRDNSDSRIVSGGVSWAF